MNKKWLWDIHPISRCLLSIIVCFFYTIASGLIDLPLREVWFSEHQRSAECQSDKVLIAMV